MATIYLFSQYHNPSRINKLFNLYEDFDKIDTQKKKIDTQKKDFIIDTIGICTGTL